MAVIQMAEYSLFPTGNLANKLGQGESLKRSATNYARSWWPILEII